MKSELLSFVFDRVDVEDDIEKLSGRLNPAAAPIDTYICRPTGLDGNLSMIFNTPESTPCVFFALASSRTRDAAQYVANLEEYAWETHRHLHYGDLILTPGGEDAGFPYASVLLRTASSPLLKAVPDRATFGGREIFFYLVMPMTRRDHTYRANLGHDRLMDRLDAEGRSLSLFGP